MPILMPWREDVNLPESRSRRRDARRPPAEQSAATRSGAARQHEIADAHDKPHRAGIVRRDLKLGYVAI